MDRRAFLRAMVATGVAVGASGTRLRLGRTASFEMLAAPGARTESVLDLPAAECPVDTVVIVVMENRSFDHYLGWLAEDEAYLEAGRARYGPSFFVNGEVHQTYPNRAGLLVDTISAASLGGEHVETRGCGYRGPGHDWLASRRERDRGFLAAGTGNDRFALTYYEAEDLPVYAAFARRFSVFDRWHASLLGPTFPNRQYLVSGQSEGRKSDPVPLRAGIFRAETIYERLSSRAVPVAYYHTSAPLLALWGADRMAPFIRSLDRYFEDAGAGTLPNVSFIDPELGGGLRTDDHPQGDIRMGQRWVREIFKAFVASPQWERGALFVTYDEGGGFFDHVRPPVLADERARRRDIDNFGQAGFRVPTILASPYARPGSVDHRQYDHTSLLRFLEWRFLGAPAEGTGGGRWALTQRDRHALNPGRRIAPAGDPAIGFDVDVPVPPPTANCTVGQRAALPPDRTPDPFDHAPELDDLEQSRFPGATYRPWLTDAPGTKNS